MKFISYTFLIIMILTSKQSDSKKIYINLAKSIIENNDEEQINSLKSKFKTYKKDPSTVFSDGWYYYDTKNQKYQKSRGTTDGLKNNIYWFLLIDNLHFGHYIWEIDWKQPEKEILGVIEVLAEKKGYELPNIASAQDRKNLDAGGKLTFYNKFLKVNGFTLVNLYIDSDSYVTALIKEDNFKKISKLANLTGNKITEY
ncbi:DUF6630 family protein [Psychroflexus montanilacus]|uniref:DUF6630 family protein n=1 Tax=Psychroflexus montanilacus TaxID=2873598 RepID=UPI001CD02EF4|nr:DUF6630 family protein [Psychroflexus montanilacus]MBZ9652855.1 hypothetical protein [Psychroflexus montanilacus]